MADVFCAAVGLLGILVLLSWQSSLWRMSALGAEYVPMAPSTALLMLLLCLSIFVQLHWPGKPAAGLLALLAALGVLAYGLLAWAQFPLGFELPLEQRLAPVTTKIGDIPLGRMSPLTAASFAVSALAVLLWLPPLGGRRSLRQTSAALALGVLLMSLLVMLSYALEAPILYGGQTIPMALSTAILFSLLGCAILAVAGPGTWLFSFLQPTTISPSASPFSRSSLGPVAAILLLTLAFGATGFFYLEHQLASSRKTAQDELWAIATLKVDQIAAWHEERLADARVIFDNAMAQAHAQHFLTGAARQPRDQADLQSWFESLANNTGYSLVALYDAQGMALVWTPSRLASLDAEDRQVFQTALHARGIVETDLHLHQEHGEAAGSEIHYAIWVPIGIKAKAGEPADGALLLQMDPNTFLYPLIRSWPTASRTAETLLVRREDGEVVFLNELRHRQGAPLSFRMPIDPQGKLPAARAVMGREGIIEGSDYRGIPVLAAIRGVPGTPWFMVAKVDQEEIYSPLRERALTTAVITFFLILAAGLGVGLFWRQRENLWLKERLTSEQERQALADRILNLNRHANDIILLLDQDWRILEANERALRAYGYSSEELTGLSLRDLRAAGQRQGFDLVASAGGSLDRGVYETVHQRKDGSAFPVEVSLSEVEIGGKKHRQAVIRDIAERRQAEEELRGSEERYRVLFERSGDGIVILDAEGPEAGRILDLNEAVVKSHGYTREELLAMKIADLAATVPEAEIAGRFQRFLAGEWLKFEAMHSRKDGSEFPVEVSAGCLELGRRRRIVAFERDISDRKQAERERSQLEKQLRQAQKMEAIGTLAGGIAHDFNNLLAVIVGFSELIIDGERGQGPDSVYLQQILEAGERAKRLVEQIMIFSRRTMLEVKKLDVNELIGQAASLLERTLSKMISVETHLAEDLQPIDGDPNELEQVLLNLATNAQDAMPQGGLLVFETSNVTVGEEYTHTHLKVARGDYVLLQVSDTGQGMDERTREQIFDPFFTTKEVGKGTGLGLSTVYGIVKGHGGHIFCYSEPGQGTAFKIYLPVHTEDRALAAVAARAAEQPAGGDERILLVDDEKALLELGEAILARAGYTVITAQGGEEALELYRREADSVDLVVMDLGMPGMGGYKCLQQMLAIKPQTKVLIASGYSAQAQVKDSLRAGATGYVSKPFRKETLLASVRKVLDTPS
jgi:PAS domain S-box-containing protein